MQDGKVNVCDKVEVVYGRMVVQMHMEVLMCVEKVAVWERHSASFDHTN